MEVLGFRRNLRPGGPPAQEQHSSQGDKPWTCYDVAPEPPRTFNLFVAPATPRLMSHPPLKDGNFVEDADLDTEPGGDGCF